MHDFPINNYEPASTLIITRHDWKNNDKSQESSQNSETPTH